MTGWNPHLRLALALILASSSAAAQLPALATRDGLPFLAGLRPGDLIIGVNRRRVGTIAELAKALAGSERAALNVVRGDFLLTIPVR